MRIKKGDTVTVMAGKDKGKTGTISRALPREGKVVIDGVNIRKRHRRASRGQKGEIVEYAAPVDASNVMLVDPKEGTPTRTGMQMKDGKKVRVAKKSGAVLDG